MYFFLLLLEATELTERGIFVILSLQGLFQALNHAKRLTIYFFLPKSLRILGVSAFEAIVDPSKFLFCLVVLFLIM